MNIGFAERVRMEQKNPGSSWILTQDLPNISQMLLPLSHLDPWQRSGRQAT